MFPIRTGNSPVNAASSVDNAMAVRVRRVVSKYQSLAPVKTARQQDFLSQKERSSQCVLSMKPVSPVSPVKTAPLGASAIRLQIPSSDKLKYKPRAPPHVPKIMNVPLALAAKGFRLMVDNSSTSVRLTRKYFNALMEAIKVAAVSVLSDRLMTRSPSVTALY